MKVYFFFSFFLCSLFDSSTFQVPVSTAQTWYTSMISTHNYFMEFTGTQSVLPFSLLTLFIVPIFMRMHVFMRCDL